MDPLPHDYTPSAIRAAQALVWIGVGTVVIALTVAAFVMWG